MSDVCEESRTVIDEAAKRVQFDLTYERAAKPREFHEDGITGGDIADAFGEPGDRASADWSNGGRLFRYYDTDPIVTEAEALASFFTDAVSEAVHEALEWFRLDGKCALDPHGNHESAIYQLSAEFAAKLWALRQERAL